MKGFRAEYNSCEQKRKKHTDFGDLMQQEVEHNDKDSGRSWYQSEGDFAAQS